MDKGMEAEMKDFHCNKSNEKLFPLFIGKYCQWWTCNICHACLSHCEPESHAEILKQGHIEWEEVVKKAGAQYVEIEQ